MGRVATICSLFVRLFEPLRHWPATDATRATTSHPASAQTQTFRFDRSRVGDRLIFDFPIGGLGPLSPYQALRAFLTNGAGLVLHHKRGGRT